MALAPVWNHTLSNIPEDTMDRASSLVRKANGQPSVGERLEFLQEAGQYIERMRAPMETRAFDLQRCDPMHNKEPYLILVRVDLTEEAVRRQVREAMVGLAEETVIPDTAYMVAVTWYYALFTRRGTRHAEQWRMPGGYIFPHDGGDTLGWCPPNVVEVKPRFQMNMNTLNLLMNIRDYAKKMEEEGTPFDTSRSLNACAKEVPRSKESNKRRRIDGEEDGSGEEGSGEEGGGEEGQADTVGAEVVATRKSDRVGRQRILQVPEAMTPVKTSSSVKGRKRKGKGRGSGRKQQPAYIERMMDFAVVCWEKYGEGKSYKRVKDFNAILQKVKALPAEPDDSGGGGGGDSSSSSVSSSPGRSSSSDGGEASDGSTSGSSDGRGDGSTSSPPPRTHAGTGVHGGRSREESLDELWQSVEWASEKVPIHVLQNFCNAIAVGLVKEDDVKGLAARYVGHE